MIRKSLLGFLSLGLIALATSPVNADITAATTNGTISAVATGGGQAPQSLGFDFVATTNINITSLGIYNAANPTGVTTQTVYLYDVTTGTPDGSAVVTLGATGFDYAAFAFSVKAGDIYSVYSVYSGVSYGLSNTTPSITLASGLGNVLPTAGTNGQGGLYTNGAGNTPPTNAYNLVATNFTYTPAVTPEPASIAMLGLGLAGATFVARRKMAKRSA